MICEWILNATSKKSSHMELVAVLILTQLALLRTSKDYVYGIWVYLGVLIHETLNQGNK